MICTFELFTQNRRRDHPFIDGKTSCVFFLLSCDLCLVSIHFRQTIIHQTQRDEIGRLSGEQNFAHSSGEYSAIFEVDFIWLRKDLRFQNFRYISHLP